MAGLRVPGVMRRWIGRVWAGPRVVVQAGGVWQWRSGFWGQDGSCTLSAGLETLGSGVRLCHDSGQPVQADWRAGSGLRLKTSAFDGTFLSVILDPPGGADGVEPRHIIEVRFDLQGAAGPVYVRLNLRNGANLERQVCTLAGHDGPQVAEFDLYHMPINRDLVTAMWIDLLLPPVAEAEVGVSAAVVRRRLRAAF